MEKLKLTIAERVVLLAAMDDFIKRCEWSVKAHYDKVWLEMLEDAKAVRKRVVA